MLKVMLVDDMDIVRIGLKRMGVWGEKTGFVVVEEAKNGEDAIRKLEKNSIDLVITDIKMPKVDGMELLNHIVQRNLCSCVVLLSDFSEFSYARQGIILGAFDFLTKPANEEEMEKLLERAYEHITNRKREAERVKKLEEVFEERAEEFYQKDDINKIAELIQSREPKAIDSIRHILERIGAALDYDVIKLEGVMKKAVPKVMEAVLLENSWLEKYINTDLLANLTVHKFTDYNELLNFIIMDIQKLFDLLKTIQLGYPDKGIVWDVSNYILQNIDNGLSLQMVAEKLYMNKTYISEVFKQKTGIPFIEYLTMVKMERAKQILAIDGLKSYEAAEVLGFKDSEYFAKLFKKYTGKSVSDIRLKK